MTGMSWLPRLIRCKRGNTLIIVAAAAPLLIGASAIGVDTIQVALAKRQLQRAADSAAMAGAYSVLQSGAATTAVTRDLTHNNRITLAAAPTVENAPTTGPFAGNARAVRVVLRANRSVPFMSFFTGSTMAVEVEATAAAVPDGIYCVVSLENTSVTGVSFSGSTNTDLGCGVATNSTGPEAISVNGNPSVRASPIAAVGGVPAASRFASGTVTLPYSPPQPDPFVNLPAAEIPSGTSCEGQLKVQPNDPPLTITSNRNCFRGTEINGPVTFSPGVYYIDGNSLSFGAQARVTGTGVTFILTSSTPNNANSIAQLDMNGGATLDLTAPSSGPYSGVLVYQHRNAPLTNQHINGNSNSRIDGAFYMPSTEITFNGNAGMEVQCLRLVGRRVNFSGNSNLVNTCPPTSPTRGFNGLMVRLVG
ncbi:MAG: pilus assembly protein TadG-related protein [Allosphingosinicella sp.]|uniref:pilus assembly protein TadG-related protein n=1 Tax=Allosphingosinicella sp. TaxID=2823234 RepID=UPI0039518B1A